MTSEASQATETWVWIHLPGQLDATLCGVIRHRGFGVQKEGRFVYGKTYLSRSDAVPLDPVSLPLQEREFVWTHLNGWFPVFLDAGPDTWGQRVIDRAVGHQDQRGYLLHAYGEPVGAITFSASRHTPPLRSRSEGIQSLQKTIALHALVETGASLSDEEASLLLGQAGTGGARPKLTVESDGQLWLVKGESIRDSADLAPVPMIEAALLELAAEVGIRSTQARLEFLGEGYRRPVLLVPRFDRKAVEGGFARRRYVSAQTVRWGRPEVAQYSFIGSYQNVAKCLIEWVAAPREEQRELYRRIVFNALVGNLDDHDKNHGLIAGDDGSFRLSPVFDLSITARHLGREGFHELAMPFGEDGARISIDNLLSRSAEFGYPKEQAQDLIAFQWSVIRTGLIQKLVESGCPEAVADRTSRLMPGHSLFGHAHAANNPSKSSKGGDDVDGGHGEAEPLISTERKRPKQRKT